MYIDRIFHYTPSFLGYPPFQDTSIEGFSKHDAFPSLETSGYRRAMLVGRPKAWAAASLSSLCPAFQPGGPSFHPEKNRPEIWDLGFYGSGIEI